jgi:Fe-S-cluster-containing dehydrogenase component
MAKQLGFFVDSSLCTGCNTCAMACKNQYHQAAGLFYREVYSLSLELFPHRDRAFYSLACNHCGRPVCLEGCPVGAYRKRADGVVVQDNAKCIGCEQCVRSCPFGAPRYNATTKRAEKCGLCHERLDDGRDPSCVQGCPTGALKLVDLLDAPEPEGERFPPGFPPESKPDPSVRFRPARQPVVVRRAV